MTPMEDDDGLDTDPRGELCGECWGRLFIDVSVMTGKEGDER